MRHLMVCASVLLSAVSAQRALNGEEILPTGISTITLSRGSGFVGETPMSIAYHPDFDHYYGSNGGSTGVSGFVWDKYGTLIQTRTPMGLDLRALNFNPHTNAIEGVTYGARDGDGGTTRGLFTMGLDGSGLLTGVNQIELASLPGLLGLQTGPAYDPTRDRFYSIGGYDLADSDPTINVLTRSDGTLLSTITLDFVAAGSPKIQNGFIGFDPDFDVLVTIDRDNERALVFALDGEFLGASQLSDFNRTEYGFNAGYANGQVFVFDTNINAYRGFQVLIPEPSTLALLCMGAVGLLACGRRKRRRGR